MGRFASHLDDFGKAAWIGLTVLSFLLWWPLGLVVLGFLIGSGRIMCWTEGTGPRWQRRFERMQRAAERWSTASYRGATGNRAFDEYRAETLRRLEDEQREFMAFLDRLRRARDKAEFDQFMAERSGRAVSPALQPQDI
jgi:ABC-type multidrug transport system fused ATPase/permease subunit